MIVCTNQCVYQNDGICELDHAGTEGSYAASAENGKHKESSCLYRVPRVAANHRG